MPVIEMPDGTQVEFPDDMSDEEIQSLIRKKFPKDVPGEESKTYAFGRGAVQGALYDIPEAIGQIFEHASGLKIPIPQNVRDWFYEVRQKTEETGAGQLGRVAGGVGSLLVAPEFAVGARAAVAAGKAEAATIRAAEAARAAKPAAAAAKPPAVAASVSPASRTIGQLAERTGATLSPGGPTATSIRAAEEAARARAEAAGLPRSTKVRPELPPPKPSQFARVTGQAIGGAGIAAAQPVEDESNFAHQKAVQALTGGALGGVAGSKLGEVAMQYARHHPWYTSAAVMHPSSMIPSLSVLAGLGLQRGLERAGPRVTIPLGVAGGQLTRGTPEEPDDGETQ